MLCRSVVCLSFVDIPFFLRIIENYPVIIVKYPSLISVSLVSAIFCINKNFHSKEASFKLFLCGNSEQNADLFFLKFIGVHSVSPV